MSKLSCRNLSVGYRGAALLSDITLNVEEGEILTLIGPNGVGKSTVLKTLARQLPPIGGIVELDGKELFSYDGAAIAKKMAVLFPERRIPQNLSCMDVVAAGRYPYTGRFNRLTDKDIAATEEALAFVGITEAARNFGELSDGQRQRVLIARTIAQEPSVIILDEPTAFLDVRYKIEILSVLRRLADERNICVILSLHDVDLARRVADTALLLFNERSVRYGRATDMITEENMRILFHMEDIGFDTRFSDYRFW